MNKNNNLSKSQHMLYRIKKYMFKKKYYHKELFFESHGYELNLKKPKNFDEKIHYLILYKHGKREGLLSDKILVKDYVKNLNVKGLHTPKTLFKYKSSKEIDINKLPDKFVLKCNHWSGDVFICNNKEKFNFSEAFKKLDEIVKKDFSKKLGEYHYKYIKPYIFAEEYLDDLQNKNPLDYKIYCVNGKAKSILVCSEREKKLRLSEYDLNFKEIDCLKKEFKPSKKIDKPKKLKELIKIAEKLSQNIPFVRVDLYEISNKIYFGEYTFTPAAGNCFYYNEYGQKLHGSYINIDQK